MDLELTDDGVKITNPDVFEMKDFNFKPKQPVQEPIHQEPIQHIIEKPKSNGFFHPPEKSVHNESQKINPESTLKKAVYYTLIIFLASLIFLIFIGIMWFGYNFAKFSDKDFSSNIPVTVNDQDTNYYNHTITTSRADTFNFQNINNNTHIFEITNKIDMPEEFFDEMIEDIVEGVVVELNETYNCTG